jgi:hypothetical protein
VVARGKSFTGLSTINDKKYKSASNFFPIHRTSSNNILKILDLDIKDMKERNKNSNSP